MGVPAFFRWLTLRYPKSVVDSHPSNLQYDLPHFDNLYLDMNGIIHPCCHPQDSSKVLTEAEMFASICRYIDSLCAIVRPRKLIYLAVDGVAPRAKMNQQRARRYRKIQEENERAKGHAHQSASFDSNVITPGTDFMHRLSLALNAFIQQKLASDWSGLTVLFSVISMQDSSDPGEGEHKILRFVRLQRVQETYNPNTKHCIYGADADLIMLSLMTHEVHFFIIREQVFDFATVVCKMCGHTGHFANECVQERTEVHRTKFQFIRVPVLREYLYFEFETLQAFPYYDFERIIDDFVLLCFFVGNDFLPHLPSLSIREGAVDSLVYLYKKNFPRMGGYLTEDGDVIHCRLDLLMQDLAIIEEPWFKQHLERKGTDLSVPQKRSRGEMESLSEAEKNEAAAQRFLKEIEKMLAEEAGDNSALCDSWEWKVHYYREKFKAADSDLDELVSMVRTAYLHGISWVFRYYYQGCCSWGWFYPFHYAPFASDLRLTRAVKPAFTLGAPFRPFSQLVAVLPPGSAHALPNAYKDLVLSPESEICDFFPEDFVLDMNGARYAYQGVILLPFIEEGRLLAALSAREDKLSPEERARNELGCAHLYRCSRHVVEAVLVPLPRAPAYSPQEGVSIEAVSLPAEVKHTSRLLPGAVEPPNVINRELFDCSDRSTFDGNSQIKLLQKYLGTTELHAQPRADMDRQLFSESYNNNRGLCAEPAAKKPKQSEAEPSSPSQNSVLIACLQKLLPSLSKKRHR